MRPVGGVLGIESFNEGVEVVYGPGWESTVPGQCCSLEGCREDTIENHIIVGVEVHLC